MPRTPRRTTTDRGDVLDAAVEGVAPRTMIAAAQRITTGNDIRRISQSSDGWARQAWIFYDTIGEFRYAVDWVAQMIAKAQMLLTRNGEPLTEGDPAIASVPWLTNLFASLQVRQQILRHVGLHLPVAHPHHPVEGQTQHQVEGGFFLDVVVRQRAAILQLFAGEDQALLVRRKA